jgi:hypothetical protein
MPDAPPHDTNDIIIAATLWLMHRYQQTRCRKLARMVELHLGWMQRRASHPVLANACRRLAAEWRAQTDSASPATLH